MDFNPHHKPWIRLRPDKAGAPNEFVAGWPEKEGAWTPDRFEAETAPLG